jgi:hypothetical protein
MTDSFTSRQAQFLAFIYYYTKIHGFPPAEADMQRYFRTSPAAIHQTIVSLEKRGLIEKFPGQARSIRLLISRDKLPDLEWPKVDRGGSKMPKEIFPSSYECDCGHLSHFFENTIKGIKKLSMKKRQILAGSEVEEHRIVFHRGQMIEIICPKEATKDLAKMDEA